MPCRQQPGCEGAAPTTERARAVWMRQQHRIHTGPLLNPRAHRPAPTRPCPAPRRCRSSQHGIGDPERVAGQTASPGAHTHAPARPPPNGCRAGGRTCCRPLRAPARPAQAPHRRPLLAWRRRTKIDGPGSRTISIQTSHAPREFVLLSPSARIGSKNREQNREQAAARPAGRQAGPEEARTRLPTHTAALRPSGPPPGAPAAPNPRSLPRSNHPLFRIPIYTGSQVHGDKYLRGAQAAAAGACQSIPRHVLTQRARCTGVGRAGCGAAGVSRRAQFAGRIGAAGGLRGAVRAAGRPRGGADPAQTAYGWRCPARPFEARPRPLHPFVATRRVGLYWAHGRARSSGQGC